MRKLSDNLLDRLTLADVVCNECGTKYGKYSVGCSSSWIGTCNVCGENKAVTEVRDYGYLQKGINEVRNNIKTQSKKVADCMLSVGPLMNDEELENELTPAYEQGEITLKLTEDEIAYLNHCLDVISEAGLEDEDVAMFEEIEKKITGLYNDYCIKYSLSPALEAYNKKYGTWGTGEDELRWEGFRDAYNMLSKQE